MQWTSSSPPQDPAEQGSVQALRRRKASLHLRYGDFVLWRWAEKRQTTRNRTEHFVWVYHTSEKPVFIYRYGRDIAVVLGYGNRTLKKKRTWLGPPFETTAPTKWKKMNYYAAGSLWVRLDICVYMHIISHAYVESKAVWSYQRGRKIDTRAIAFHSAHECNCWNMPQVMKWPSHQNISFYIAMVTPHQARWKWQFNMHSIASNFPLFGRH